MISEIYLFIIQNGRGGTKRLACTRVARVYFNVLLSSCHYTTNVIVIAFKSHLRTVTAPSDGNQLEFYEVSMTPGDWYQWLDPNQPDDGLWDNVSDLPFIITQFAKLMNNTQSETY